MRSRSPAHPVRVALAVPVVLVVTLFVAVPSFAGAQAQDIAAGVATRGGGAAEPAGAGGPAALKVAVVDLTVTDNSFNGDSDRLAAWLSEERIDPTAVLRREIQKPETYAALEGVPTVIAIEAAGVGEALAAKGMEARTCGLPCAIEVGRKLGADRVITGEVTKLSNLIWFVTAGVTDLERGRILRRDELEVKGVIQDMMPKVMASLSRRLVTAN